jgi:Protein of unknown function (DUF2894)
VTAPTPEDAADPVRQRHIDALRRRAARHQGPARQLIEARLLGLQRAQGPSPGVLQRTEPEAPLRPSRLGELLDHIGRHTAPAGELKALHHYRGTWVRLGMEQRLRQTAARVPDKAGPLNTHRLLHEALTAMRHASPAYFQHFMEHVDSLLALDASAPAPDAAKRDPGRRVRKP